MKAILIVLLIVAASYAAQRTVLDTTVLDTTITADTVEVMKKIKVVEYDTLIVKKTISDTSLVIKEDTLKSKKPVNKKESKKK